MSQYELQPIFVTSVIVLRSQGKPYLTTTSLGFLCVAASEVCSVGAHLEAGRHLAYSSLPRLHPAVDLHPGEQGA